MRSCWTRRRRGGREFRSWNSSSSSFHRGNRRVQRTPVPEAVGPPQSANLRTRWKPAESRVLRLVIGRVVGRRRVLPSIRSSSRPCSEDRPATPHPYNSSRFCILQRSRGGGAWFGDGERWYRT